MNLITKKLLFIFVLLLAQGAAFGADSRDYVKLQFTLARTFHKPIEIVVDSDYDMKTIILSVKIYSGRGGYDWGKVEEERSKAISREEFTLLAEKMESLDLAALYKDYPEIESGDGSSWQLGGTRRGSGFLYNFQSPPTVPKAAGLVDYVKDILRKAGVSIPDEEFY